jgi:hypothetical protein
MNMNGVNGNTAKEIIRFSPGIDVKSSGFVDGVTSRKRNQHLITGGSGNMSPPILVNLSGTAFNAIKKITVNLSGKGISGVNGNIKRKVHVTT